MSQLVLKSLRLPREGDLFETETVEKEVVNKVNVQFDIRKGQWYMKMDKLK